MRRKTKLKNGDVVDAQYRIEGVVGKGGFGAVYKATQLSSGRSVALKILLANYSSGETDAKRFQREASLVQKLQHPSVVELIDFGHTESGVPYIAFELLQGEALGKHLTTHGALSLERTVEIGRSVLGALDAAHSLGIVHRDIKPQNIYLVSDASAKVLDFGIAKALKGEESQATQLTESGQMIGTPHYMAPEQVRGTDVGPTTDLYALGLLLAEMLTGGRVITGDSLIDVYMTHISEDALPFSKEVIDSPIGPVIRKAAAKIVESRYGSAAEMLAALDEAVGGAPGARAEATTRAIAQVPNIVDLESTVMVDSEHDAGPVPAPQANVPSAVDRSAVDPGVLEPRIDQLEESIDDLAVTSEVNPPASFSSTVVMDLSDHARSRLDEELAARAAAAAAPEAAAPEVIDNLAATQYMADGEAPAWSSAAQPVVRERQPSDGWGDGSALQAAAVQARAQAPMSGPAASAAIAPGGHTRPYGSGAQANPQGGAAPAAIPPSAGFPPPNNPGLAQPGGGIPGTNLPHGVPPAAGGGQSPWGHDSSAQHAMAATRLGTGPAPKSSSSLLLWIVVVVVVVGLAVVGLYLWAPWEEIDGLHRKRDSTRATELSLRIPPISSTGTQRTA